MKIIHFSISPLAGAPINTVHALKRNSDYDVRLVDLKRWNKFGHDLVFEENKEEIIQLVEDADVIHFHNYLTLDSKEFLPINFRDLYKKGKKFVIHYHSSPQLISKTIGKTIDEIISPEIPSLVIAQFQERFYPNSRVIPNLISDKISELKVKDEKIKDSSIFYSPTNKLPAFSKNYYDHVRWNTKGYYEIIKVLKKINKNYGADFSVFRKRSFDDTIKKKWTCQIVIDDIITGSFHLTGLEALAMGKTVLSHTDERTTYVLKEISGSDINPFVNAKLEELEYILSYFVKNTEACSEIGNNSKKWIDEYWNEKINTKKIIDVYKDLLLDPNLITKQNSLKIDNSYKRSKYIEIPDLMYKSRSEVYLKNRSIMEKSENWLINKIDRKRYGVAAKKNIGKM